MSRILPVLAAGTTAAVLLLAPQVATADESTAYADGFSYTTNGTGTATARPEADRAGNLKASANATGGSAFLIPALKLLPYTKATNASANAYISDGIGGSPGVEAGHRYRISVTFSALDVETSTSGNGSAVARIHAQATNGFRRGRPHHDRRVHDARRHRRRRHRSDLRRPTDPDRTDRRAGRAPSDRERQGHRQCGHS